MRRLFLAAVIAAVVTGLLTGPAAAATSFRNCGSIYLNGRGYTVRAHVVSCSFAKTWSKRYLSSRRRPSGYSCRRFSSRDTRVVFLCQGPGRSYSAARR